MGLTDDDILELYAAHDPHCEIYAGECCNCEPRICFVTVAGEICIDENGALNAHCLN